MTEEVAKVYKTTDYDQFRIMAGNRTIAQSRCNRIKRSMDEVGVIAAPIIVNEKMEIVDGQGRYTVCKQNGYPVYYTVVPGIGVSECIAMNTGATSWKVSDYVHEYAQTGNESYQFLERMLDKYDLSQRVVLLVCLDRAGGGNIDKRIKRGELIVNPQYYEEIEESLTYLQTAAPMVKKLSGRSDFMYAALNWCFRHTQADPNRLLSALGNIVIESELTKNAVGTTKQALAMIENAYNNHLGRKNRIRFVAGYEDYMDGQYTWYSNKWGTDNEPYEARTEIAV